MNTTHTPAISSMLFVMPDIVQLRKHMARMIKNVSGYDENHVILMDQNTTRPTLPFIGLKITDVRKVGYDHFEYTDFGMLPNALDVEQKIAGMVQLSTHEFTCNVQGFGPETWNALNQIVSVLQSPSAFEILRESGISVYDQSEIRDISWIDNSQFKEKHTLDLFCRIGGMILDTAVGTIGTVDMDVTMTHENNDSKPIEFTVEVTDGN